MPARPSNVTPLLAARGATLPGAVSWPVLHAILLDSLDHEAAALAALEREYAAVGSDAPGSIVAKAVIASLGAQVVVAAYGDFSPLRQWVDRLLPAIEPVVVVPELNVIVLLLTIR